LAFPSNDFDGKEPDEISTIVENMKNKFGVNFEIFDKVNYRPGYIIIKYN